MKANIKIILAAFLIIIIAIISSAFSLASFFALTMQDKLVFLALAVIIAIIDCIVIFYIINKLY